MELSCHRCGRRRLVSDAWLRGRPGPIPCACGNLLSLPAEQPRAAPARAADGSTTARRDDPFLRALGAAAPADRPPDVPPGPAPPVERAPAAARLAERDPDAPTDDSGEYGVTEGYALDARIRRAQLRAFLWGVVSGAVGVAAVAGALALGAADPVATAVVAPRERAPAPAASRPEPAPDAASGPPTPPVAIPAVVEVAAPAAPRPSHRAARASAAAASRPEAAGAPAEPDGSRDAAAPRVEALPPAAEGAEPRPVRGDGAPAAPAEPEDDGGEVAAEDAP